MSPDKKLEWFHKHGLGYDYIQRIRALVVLRWEESYKQFQCSETLRHIHPSQPVVSLLIDFYLCNTNYFLATLEVYEAAISS